MTGTTLEERIASARRAGTVAIGRAQRRAQSIVQAADAAAQAAGAKPIGASWQVISESSARSIIRSLLASDLAYNARCMSDVDAGRFADEVLGLVEAPIEFLTNVGQDVWLGIADGRKLKVHTFDPLTDATLSAGVALVGREEAAVLVVSDED